MMRTTATPDSCQIHCRPLPAIPLTSSRLSRQVRVVTSLTLRSEPYARKTAGPEQPASPEVTVSSSERQRARSGRAHQGLRTKAAAGQRRRPAPARAARRPPVCRPAAARSPQTPGTWARPARAQPARARAPRPQPYTYTLPYNPVPTPRPRPQPVQQVSSSHLRPGEAAKTVSVSLSSNADRRGSRAPDTAACTEHALGAFGL